MDYGENFLEVFFRTQNQYMGVARRVDLELEDLQEGEASIPLLIRQNPNEVRAINEQYENINRFLDNGIEQEPDIIRDGIQSLIALISNSRTPTNIISSLLNRYTDIDNVLDDEHRPEVLKAFASRIRSQNDFETIFRKIQNLPAHEERKKEALKTLLKNIYLKQDLFEQVLNEYGEVSQDFLEEILSRHIASASDILPNIISKIEQPLLNRIVCGEEYKDQTHFYTALIYAAQNPNIDQDTVDGILGFFADDYNNKTRMLKQSQIIEALLNNQSLPNRQETIEYVSDIISNGGYRYANLFPTTVANIIRTAELDDEDRRLIIESFNHNFISEHVSLQQCQIVNALLENPNVDRNLIVNDILFYTNKDKRVEYPILHTLLNNPNVNKNIVMEYISNKNIKERNDIEEYCIVMDNPSDPDLVIKLNSRPKIISWKTKLENQNKKVSIIPSL